MSVLIEENVIKSEPEIDLVDFFMLLLEIDRRINPQAISYEADRGPDGG